MDNNKRETVSSKVQDYLESFDWGMRPLKLFELRTLLCDAIISYLSKKKSIDFPIEIASAIHNQTVTSLPPKLIEVTKKIQALKTCKYTQEEIKNLLYICVDTLLSK